MELTKGNIEIGQTVWVWIYREGIKETYISDIGISSTGTYVKINYDVYMKFDIKTLKQDLGHSFLILDKKDCYYVELLMALQDIEWGELEREDLDKIASIIKYKNLTFSN